MSTQDQNSPTPGGQGSDEPTLVMSGPGSASPAREPAVPPQEPEQTTPVAPPSSEATVIGKSAFAAELPEQKPGAGSPPLPPQEPEQTTPVAPPSSDATVIGKSAFATELPDQKKPAVGSPPLGPSASSISDQDTVVSPRLRQLAQTPSQPLRPPAGAPPKPGGIRQQTAGSSSRLIWLVGILGALILLVLILVLVIAVQRGPMLLSGLTATKTPTQTATRAATATSVFPPTATKAPATPTPVPPTATLAPPTATPRPAPTALGKDVLARVAPPEGLKLRVRETASAAGKLLGELDKDAQVTILEGPTDANGIKWWKVDNGKGLVGWSAEGLGTDKYLVPIGWAQ